jgi:phosphoglycerate dehydrogenase-like enzyme
MALKVFYPRQPLNLYPRHVDQQAWDALQAVLDPDIEFTAQPETPEPAEYNVLISGRPTEELLDASPNLHTVIIPWAGVPEQTGELMRRYPHLALHNLHHNAVPTAETALMLLFAAAKQILPMESAFRQDDWRPRYGPNPAKMLYGKTVLILGYGSIGEHVAQACRALGMEIVAIRRSPQGHGEHPPDALHNLLPRADVLMVTAPLTDETRGMIGEAELALMPPGGIVVNVGRGPVIDQQALYETLKSGHLHSAGIDVWYNYPPDEESRASTPPADYPFGELENIVMSPHRGGGAAEVEIRRMQFLAELLNAIARGEQAPNKVDLDAGY